MVERTFSRETRGAGFSSPFGVSEARRQLHLSVGLVTMLSIGIVSAAMAVGGHPIAATQDIVASRTPVTVLQAETRVTGAKAI